MYRKYSHIFTWFDSEYTKSYKIWSTLLFEGGVIVFIFDPLVFSNTFHEKSARKTSVSNMLHQNVSVSNTKVDQSEKLRNGSIIFVWISRWNIRLGIFKSKKVCFDKSIENAVFQGVGFKAYHLFCLENVQVQVEYTRGGCKWIS